MNEPNTMPPLRAEEIAALGEALRAAKARRRGWCVLFGDAAVNSDGRRAAFNASRVWEDVRDALERAICDPHGLHDPIEHCEDWQETAAAIGAAGRETR